MKPIVKDDNNNEWYIKKILKPLLFFLVIITLAGIHIVPVAAQEIAITTCSNDSATPQVSGHQILWCDTKFQSSWPEACFMYDINEKKVLSLPMPGPSEELREAPSFSGDRIAYTSYGNNSLIPAKIQLYNIPTRTTETITEGVDPHNAMISGNWIVWDTGQVVMGHVKTKDLTWVETWGYLPNLSSFNIITRKSTFITNDTKFKKVESLDNQYMVYAMFNNSGINIHLFNLETGEDRYIANADDRVFPRISGYYITWTDRRSGNDIHLYDIRSRNDRVIASDEQGKSDAVIDSNQVVWFSINANISELNCYNITTGRTSSQNLSLAHEIDRSSLAISGNSLVWLDKCKLLSQVYYLDLSSSHQQLEELGRQMTGTPIVADTRTPTSEMSPTQRSPGFDAIIASITGIFAIISINVRRSR
jgi:beta propeller repeat protein